MAELTLTAVPPAEAVGLTLLERRKRPVTVFASNAPLSSEIDQAQYDDDDGPCLQAYRQRAVVKVGDTATAKDRWPAYAGAATAAHVGSTLSVPLTAANETYGALNLYARNRYAFGDADVEGATVLATQATAVLPTRAPTGRFETSPTACRRR